MLCSITGFLQRVQIRVYRVGQNSPVARARPLQTLFEDQGGGKTVGIFTSGGTLATIVAQVLGLGGEKTYQFYEPVLNCSVTQLFYSRSRISLSYFNDCSFFRVLGGQRGEDLLTYR